VQPYDFHVFLDYQQTVNAATMSPVATERDAIVGQLLGQMWGKSRVHVRCPFHGRPQPQDAQTVID